MEYLDLLMAIEEYCITKGLDKYNDTIADLIAELCQEEL